MLSEAELQDQREDNELARDRAIQRAIGTTNTFTETRLQGEQDVADAAERTAAQLQREQERAATAAARIAERQQRDAERADEQEVRQAERLTEQQVREQARIAQEQEREQERQRRSAEQQAGRESAAGAGLLQTGVGRAQFELGLSTSESDFEANRQTLTAATNAYYDNELARIDELMRTEIELRDLRESNALARERALQRATDTTNPFEQQRLQDAADAQRETERATAEAERLAERQQREQTQAVERAERERVRAAERTAREQMRIAERQQREEERAIEMRIRQEMRLQDDISDLREDAVENEADRIQAITDLHENAARQREQIEKNHQDRLEDIRRSADESREGVEREFTQDIEDILRDAGVDESLFSHGNFDTIRRIAQSPSGLDDLQGFLSGLGINLDARGVEGVRSAGVDRLRGLENVDIRTGHEQENAQVRQRRALEDLAQRTEGREADINAQAEATAEALTEALTPLLGEESAFNTETAEKTDTAATNLNTAAGKTDAAATNLDTATQAFADSDLPGAVDLVRESAEASLGISEAIEMFPAALESAVTDAFDRVLGN